MIEAWFRLSDTTASSAPSSGSNSPPLASKQAANRIEVLHAPETPPTAPPAPVQILRAADEPDRGHAEPVALHRRPAPPRSDAGSSAKPKIVVGTKVQHPPPLHRHMRALRPRRSAARAWSGPRPRSRPELADRWSRNASESVMTPYPPLCRKIPWHARKSSIYRIILRQIGYPLHLGPNTLRGSGRGKPPPSQLPCTIRMARAGPSSAAIAWLAVSTVAGHVARAQGLLFAARDHPQPPLDHRQMLAAARPMRVRDQRARQRRTPSS